MYIKSIFKIVYIPKKPKPKKEIIKVKSINDKPLLTTLILII